MDKLKIDELTEEIDRTEDIYKEEISELKDTVKDLNAAVKKLEAKVEEFENG